MHSNNYKRTTNGLTLADNNGMGNVTIPRVKVCQQIIKLSAAAIADAFGVVGEAQIEGIRSAMVEELSNNPMPVSSWREIAFRIQGLSEHTNLD